MQIHIAFHYVSGDIGLTVLRLSKVKCTNWCHNYKYF